MCHVVLCSVHCMGEVWAMRERGMGEVWAMHSLEMETYQIFFAGPTWKVFTLDATLSGDSEWPYTYRLSVVQYAKRQWRH